MWKTVSSKVVFDHPRLSLVEDEVILPNEKIIKYIKFKDDGSCGAAIIARRGDGKILVQKELSYPSNQKLFQLPGGSVHPGEKLETGANRELMEEAGLKAGSLKLLGSYLINNRRSAMRMNVFLASELTEQSLPSDPEEDIESFWFSEDEIASMIKNDEISNIHMLAAWSLYTLKK